MEKCFQNSEETVSYLGFHTQQIFPSRRGSEKDTFLPTSSQQLYHSYPASQEATEGGGSAEEGRRQRKKSDIRRQKRTVGMTMRTTPEPPRVTHPQQSPAEDSGRRLQLNK